MLQPFTNLPPPHEMKGYSRATSMPYAVFIPSTQPLPVCTYKKLITNIYREQLLYLSEKGISGDVFDR